MCIIMQIPASAQVEIIMEPLLLTNILFQFTVAIHFDI